MCVLGGETFIEDLIVVYVFFLHVSCFVLFCFILLGVVLLSSRKEVSGIPTQGVPFIMAWEFQQA